MCVRERVVETAAAAGIPQYYYDYRVVVPVVNKWLRTLVCVLRTTTCGCTGALSTGRPSSVNWCGPANVRARVFIRSCAMVKCVRVYARVYV